VFWIRCRKFLGLPDPQLFVRIRIRILPSTRKKITKNLDFYSFAVLQLFNNLLPLKIDVNIPAVSNKQKKIFFVGTLKAMKKGAGSGSIIQCMDPRIRIRIKMSRIRNTDSRPTSSPSSSCGTRPSFRQDLFYFKSLNRILSKFFKAILKFAWARIGYFLYE